jgi:endonuclease YncB( thermonuclease family)
MPARAGMTALPRSRLLVPTLLIALLAAALPAGADVPVRVVAVHDGDTLTVLAETRHRVRVRLVDIDAPELGQPFGKRAKASLSDLCFGKAAEMEVRGRDRYDRTLARVKCGGRDANAEQVRLGYAWVYTRYAPADSPLYALQHDAMTARRGLWSGPDPMPPWEWRRRGTASRGSAPSEMMR